MPIVFDEVTAEIAAERDAPAPAPAPLAESSPPPVEAVMQAWRIAAERLARCHAD